MITYNNLPVLIIPYKQPLNSFNLTKSWKDFSHRLPAYRDYVLLNTSISNFIKYIKDNTKDVIDNNLNYKIYFTPSSEFPRFKLEGSKFSRCLKPEKADYAVIGSNYGYDNLSLGSLLYKGENKYYLFRSNNLYSTRYRKDSQELSYESDLKGFINQYKSKIFPEDVEFVTDCTNYSLIYGLGKVIDLFVNNVSINIIMDKTLDNIINNNFDILNSETYKTICDMLDSEDTATRGLGLKMLTGFNVSKTPNAIRFMLGIRECKVRGLNEWNSVGVEQVKKSIGWRGFGSFPNRMYNIVPRDNAPITEEDKLLIKDVYKNGCEYYIDRAIEELKRAGFVTKFGLNISYEVTG